MPSCPCLVIQADNCVRENKNNTILKFIAVLLAKRRFALGALLFSAVGHTHGPLGALEELLFNQENGFVSCPFASQQYQDQVFGLLATAMRYCDILSDGQDMAECLS